MLIYHIDYLASSYDRIKGKKREWEKLTLDQQTFLYGRWANYIAKLSDQWTKEGDLEEVILEMEEEQI